jgi:hypothetical protein
VAAAWHPRYQRYLRVEHWANAFNQGPAAARSMLGIPTSYERLPYFYSDQYDLGMEYSGLAATWDEVVVRGDPATHAFLAFWLKDGRVVAGMNANVWDVTEAIQTLIRNGRPVDPERLADPGIPLDQVTGEQAGALAARSTNDQAAPAPRAVRPEPWLDNLTRGDLTSGRLRRLVAQGIRGVTSNPTIIAKAIGSSADYDGQLAALTAAGRDAEASYWALVTSDLNGALAVLRPI